MNKIKNIYGVYMLLFFLPKAMAIEIGKLGWNDFQRGWHAYFGTAQGGVHNRFCHHSRFAGNNKTPFYNVDWFREHAVLHEIWFAHEKIEYECRWSAEINRLRMSSVPAKRMGGRDCRPRKNNFYRDCPAHFYKLKNRPTTALLRSEFDSMPIQVAELEPRVDKRKPKIEWESDYWVGRRLLEQLRLEIYHRDMKLPPSLSNVTGNPVLRELLSNECGDNKAERALKLKQLKLADAVDSLIANHGERAYSIIFNTKEPLSRQDVFKASRADRLGQDDQILTGRLFDTLCLTR